MNNFDAATESILENPKPLNQMSSLKTELNSQPVITQEKQPERPASTQKENIVQSIMSPKVDPVPKIIPETSKDLERKLSLTENTNVNKKSESPKMTKPDESKSPQILTKPAEKPANDANTGEQAQIVFEKEQSTGETKPHKTVTYKPTENETKENPLENTSPSKNASPKKSNTSPQQPQVNKTVTSRLSPQKSSPAKLPKPEIQKDTSAKKEVDLKKSNPPKATPETKPAVKSETKPATSLSI